MTDEWKLQGVCRGMDPTLFYPPQSHPVYWYPKKEAAKACAQCEVRDECLEYALRHEDYGFWGGLDEMERRKLRKARGIRLEPKETILRLVQPHGTPAAYTRHKRNGEEACEYCKQAWNRSKENTRKSRKGELNWRQIHEQS